MNAVPQHPLLKAGDHLMNQGNFVEAVTVFRQYLAEHKDDDEAYEKLGFCLGQMRKFEEASSAYRMAVSGSKGRLSAVIGLSDMYAYMFKTDEARATLEAVKGRELVPMQQAFVDVAYGNICALEYNVDKGIEHFLAASKVIPGFWPIWVNLGHLYMEKLDLGLAGRAYEMAYKLKPDNINTAMALCHWCMSTGDWKRGWEIQEWRVNEPNLHHHPDNDRYVKNIPRWDGERVKTLAIWHEGGLGDLTHFMRYVREAATRCDHILFCMPERYLGWMMSFAWPRNVHLMTKLSYGTYDAHTALMSLPLNLKLYAPEQAPRPPMTHLIPDRTERPQIIINWFGSSEHPNDVARSMKLDDLARIVRSRPDIHWVNVSPEQRVAEEMKAGPYSFGGLNIQWRPGSIVDAAKQMLESDLVISVDSGQAHMAATLGVPVWLLQPHLPEWRWGWQVTTPLYPSVLIFRQTHARDWSGPLQHVAEQLDIEFPRE